MEPEVIEHRVRERYARTMTSAQQVDEFEALRPHLLAVAYRLTGTFADAEDVVQEAWLRWNGPGTTRFATCGPG
ncbi:sigma-70 region 2 family protein [Mycobacterium xenopi 4042]|uniref:Sigma-70 region 2 family protein n=1 Tax=Mycobacterium xenopi 4042 TaxID=1299334 RepID=X7YI95_MYCXE|nr:sigma-70 region 2 family protein [Mycobacterium xenopi 4042]